MTGKLGHAVTRKEARQKYIGVRQVKLFGSQRFHLRINPEDATLNWIEERRENSREVKAWKAEEVDRSGKDHQCRRPHVPDYAMALDRLCLHLTMNPIIQAANGATKADSSGR